MAANHAVNPTCPSNGDGASWTCGSGPGYAYNNLPATVVRGDTYYLGSGTFTSAASDGLNWITAASGSGTVTLKKATADDYGGLAGWQASYGTGPLTISGTAQFYIAISNIVVDGARRGTDQISGYGIVINNTATTYTNGVAIATGVNNVTLQYMEIGGNTANLAGASNGVIMNASTLDSIHDITIRANYIHDWSQDLILMRNVGTVVIDQNHLARNFNDGITHGQGVSNDCSHAVTVSRNTFRDVLSSGQIATGMSLTCSSDNWQIYSNLFYRSSDSAGSTVEGGGIRAWDGYGTRTGWWIVGNTFAGISPALAQTAIQFPTGSTGNYAYNNLFWNSWNGSVSFTSVDNHDYNSFFAQSSYPSEGNSQVSASNPFVSSAGYNFHLAANTSAWSALASPYNVDLDGRARSFSRGAYEFAPPTTLRGTVRGATIK